MKSLLKFESKKFCLNIKNIFLIMMVMIISLFLCYQHTQKLKIDREETIDNAKYIMDKITSDADYYTKDNPELIPYFNKSISKLSEKFEYAYSDGWKKSLKAENEFIDNISILQSKLSVDYVSDDYLQNKNKNMYYLHHNIKPDNELYGVSGMYYIRYICSVLFTIVGYFFFIFLFYDLFLKEGQREGRKLLKTIPVSYKSIEKIRLIIAIISFIIIFSLLLGSCFLYGLINSKNVGSINYPVFYAYDESISVAKFTNYFGLCLLVFFGIMLLTLLVILWLSRYRINPDRVLFVIMAVFLCVFEIIKSLDILPKYFLYGNYIDIYKQTSNIFSQGILIYHISEIIILYLVIFVIQSRLFTEN